MTAICAPSSLEIQRIASAVTEVSSVRRSEEGFTLLELLVVITILGLLIALVAPRLATVLGGAKDKIAAQSIDRLGTVLDMYKLDVGTYPSTEQGLQSLLTEPSGAANWHGPYVKGDKLPTDPWGRLYEYRQPSMRAGRDYDLCSGGDKGQATSPDATGAICN
jgi:general secretion pathway protein G